MTASLSERTMLHKALHEPLTFAIGFLRNPGQNGSVVPSSRFLKEAMLADLPWKRIETLVELGPGVGTFTGAIMERIRPDARVILVELNPLYATHLRERYKGQGVIVETTSAADLGTILSHHGINRPDCIISGLPLASLPIAVSRRIADQIRHFIARGTLYRSFTYRPAKTMAFFGAGVLHRKSPLIWQNFPPAVVLGAPACCIDVMGE
ncbi:Methyltransferase domain-containing protein [Azospirillaceae bacterium]